MPSQLSPQAAVGLQTFFQILALCTSILRIAFRAIATRMWYEDYALILSLVLSFVPYGISLYVTLQPPIETPTHKLGALRVLASFTTYTAALWSARVSVACSIVRLNGDGTRRNVAKTAVWVLFILPGTVLTLWRIFLCGIDFSMLAHCQVPTYTGYVDLGLNIAGDLWLILAPIVFLHKCGLPTTSRRIISATYGTGLLVTITSVVHVRYVILRETDLSLTTGQIQLSTAIITCNTLVLLPIVFRYVLSTQSRQSSSEEISTSEVPRPSSSDRFGAATSSKVGHTTLSTTIISFTDIITDFTGIEGRSWSSTGDIMSFTGASSGFAPVSLPQSIQRSSTPECRLSSV